jgi:hypothetical protein
VTGWFGESWHAPVCEETEHIRTPVGELCLDCDEPILEGDQGVTMPHWLGDGSYRSSARHLDCFIQTVLPHGPECERCRGLTRAQHLDSCAYAQKGGKCDCAHGVMVANMFNATSATLAHWSAMGAAIGLSEADARQLLEDGRNRRRALSQCRRTPFPHNPPDDSGERKA